MSIILRRFIAATVAVFAIAVTAGPPVAHADIVRSGSVFTAQPALCSCWSTVDGYQFVGIPYSQWQIGWLNSVGVQVPADAPYVAGPGSIDAALMADPAYVPLPPVTSGSVETTVSGTVNDDGIDGDSPPVRLFSYGTGSRPHSYGTGSYGTGHRLRAKRVRLARRRAHNLRAG